jgi:hypothetical protein
MPINAGGTAKQYNNVMHSHLSEIAIAQRDARDHLTWNYGALASDDKMQRGKTKWFPYGPK